MDDNPIDVQKIIRKAKASFERDFQTPGYAQIISDADHLAHILKLCDVAPGKSYLDIGTGNGYVAFELARQHPSALVTGVDILEQAIKANAQKAQANHAPHLKFLSYTGTQLPFEDGVFYGALSRYAFHHFPLPDLSAHEIYRILEPGGFCVISDPLADPADEVDFVNRFAALRNDGHVRFYQKSALIELFEGAGFRLKKKFDSVITFPRSMDERYEQLLSQTAAHISDLYQIKVEGERITITVPVMNICFRKPAAETA